MRRATYCSAACALGATRRAPSATCSTKIVTWRTPSYILQCCRGTWRTPSAHAALQYVTWRTPSYNFSAARGTWRTPSAILLTQIRPFTGPECFPGPLSHCIPCFPCDSLCLLLFSFLCAPIKHFQMQHAIFEAAPHISNRYPMCAISGLICSFSFT